MRGWSLKGLKYRKKTTSKNDQERTSPHCGSALYRFCCWSESELLDIIDDMCADQDKAAEVTAVDTSDSDWWAV
jgi:hypothetical protein